VPDTLWYRAPVLVDTTVDFIIRPNTDRSDCRQRIRIFGQWFICWHTDTIYDWKPVILQPCPRDIIIDKDIFPVLDSFPLATEHVNERKIIKDWMEWFVHKWWAQDSLACALPSAVNRQAALDKYLREKEIGTGEIPDDAIEDNSLKGETR